MRFHATVTIELASRISKRSSRYLILIEFTDLTGFWLALVCPEKDSIFIQMWL